MIQKQQITAARGLLSWSKSDLSAASGVSERTIARFEAGEGDITAGKLEKLEDALEAQGIEFINGGVVLERLKRRRQPT
jgi:transcriptional regulator with XRE-family HTH domain